MLANNLRLEFPEPKVAPDDIAALLADIDNIIDSIDEIDLPAEFKAMLKKRA
jgi:hypothetical protein